MPVHYREDSYLDKIIQQKFSASFMSNSKWVKLITALVDNWQEIKECLVKPIWDDEPPSRRLLLDEHTHYNFDYYDAAMEAMISGKPRGWYAYREIEWLDFPRLVSVQNGKPAASQNLETISQIIGALGQFVIELTTDNLRLYAYRK